MFVFSSIDEYNPYCSKWGYCISYNLFGEEGPDQSKGAVQDGTRGQCRDDKDCTPWAPSCGPLGYCRYVPTLYTVFPPLNTFLPWIFPHPNEETIQVFIT